MKRRWVVAIAVALGLMLAACSSPSEAPEATGEPTAPATTVPTPTGLADAISRLFNGSAAVTCPGEGPLSRGDALVCYRFDGEPKPLYVSVLDDDGHFVFQGSEHRLAPTQYEAGITSCRALAEPPPWAAIPGQQGLEYPMLLHYWMAAGSPPVMDDDGNGIPCETVYPAEIVQRVVSSPLRAAPQPRAAASMEDVRAFAEAVLMGSVGTGSLRCATQPAVDPDAPVRPGMAAECWHAADGAPPNYAISQDVGIVITILDSTGRFLIASGGECCGGAPHPLDYPGTGSCETFLQTPPDWGGDRSSSHALDYGQVLFWWHWHGAPGAYDPDGNLLPCEDVYPPDAVAQTLDGWLQP